MKIGVIGNISKIKDESVIEKLMQSLKDWGYESVRFSSHTLGVSVDFFRGIWYGGERNFPKGKEAKAWENLTAF